MANDFFSCAWENKNGNICRQSHSLILHLWRHVLFQELAQTCLLGYMQYFFPFLGKLSACRKRLLSWMKNSHRDKHFPWCRADGSFNPMQCYGSYCYCVNEKGIEMPGTKISTSMGRPVCTFTSRRESNRMTFFFSIVKDFYVRHLPCFVCLRWHCDFLST